MFVILLLILAIVVVLIADNTKPPREEDNIGETSDIANYRSLDRVLNEVNGKISDVRVVSNEVNNQANIVLGELGLNAKDMVSYAVSADTRQGFVHCLAVLLPKEEFYKDVKRKLADYIAATQRELLELKMTDSKEYKNTLSAVIYEHEGYLILVMESDAGSLLDDIIELLESAANFV